MPQYPSINTQPVSPRAVAEAAVRAWCGWHVSPVIEETLTLDGNGTNRLALPSNMVHAVNELLVDGMPVEGFSFSRDGWIQLPAGCITPRRPGCITAVITHGWDSVPDVQKVIADFTARAAMGAPGSIASQRAGTQYVAYATHNGEATGGGLLSTEKALLEKYKLRQVP